MKISIRTKITMMVVIFAVVIVTASWVLCNYFIENFFVVSVKNDLRRTFKACNKVFSTDDDVQFDEEFYKEIDDVTDSIILIYDTDKHQIYTSINADDSMYDSINRMLMSIEQSGVIYSEEAGQYRIIKNHDSLLNSDYLDLIGILDSGDIIIIRSPIARIDSTMRIISKVFTWVAVGLIVFGSMFILVFSNLFSRPIKRLGNAAKQMTELNFEAKVPVYSKDEIGELSGYMNLLSCKLETTISELKSANLRLEQDIEKKEKLDDMRKEFLSHVSHELKTPIALIQGYAEGLKDNIFDDEESKEFYADVIIDEAQKMNTLVKKLLDLNEIEFGGTPLRIERFELTEFIRDIISSSKILADEAKAEIIFDEESPVYVWADEYMIEGVFTNYITNAIHYVKRDGVIKVYFETAGGNIRVNVFNEGDHIADEDIDKLFIKFYKADKARTREYGGSGIGLSIVAATMAAHGKSYGVYNVPDGVVFYFELDANMPC